MAKVMAGMTVSLDGFINDSTGSVDQLYTDFTELKKAPSFIEMMANTGAVVMGRHVYEMADPFTWFNETYEFQCPVFVVTHTAPENFPKGNDKLTLTFVTDGVESAVSQAKKAAGDKLVQVIGGADTIQQCLNAGLCDELQIDLMPVLLGKGIRLLENIDTEEIKMERVSVEATTPARTSMMFRLNKE